MHFIQRAKELGFTGDTIRALMKITNNIGSATRAEVKNLTEEHIADITQKIKDLQALKKTLSEISEHCDGSDESAENCPIIHSIYGDPD